jgi:eukaryotic-like serine/threonine-protein kinase
MLQPSQPLTNADPSPKPQPGAHEIHSQIDSIDPTLGSLIDELSTRVLAGEKIDIETVSLSYPEWTDMLRTLLPAVLGLVELADNTDLSPPGSTRDDADRPIFGNFRIIREVGRGGMGIVYEAEQIALKRRVALKVLPQAAAMDPRALQRFQLEAQVAGWLQHPRIVPVHDVGTVGKIPYYAMQFVDGGSLADLVNMLRHLVEPEMPAEPSKSASGNSLDTLAASLLSGRLGTARRETSGSSVTTSATDESPQVTQDPSIRRRAYLRAVASLGVQAAEALGHAHDQGITHRDIKPANLLVDVRGELWVADFGMADVQGHAGITVTGDLPGTLRYMSPEQTLGKRALVDRRTDIYSLGATIYELLTLRTAVAGDDRLEILRRIVEEEPLPIRRLNPAVPFDLATIVAKAMSKDPVNRYETAWQLADDLGRFLDGRTIKARPVGPVARTWRWCRRKPFQAGLAAALVLAVLVGFAGVTWNWRQAERQKSLLLIAEKAASAQAAKADAINRFLIEGLLDQAEPANNPAAHRITLSEALDRAAENVGSSFPDQPEIEGTIRLAMGRAYHGLGEYFKSENHYRLALDRFSKNSALSTAGGLEAMAELGHILSHLGRWDEAEPLLAKTLPAARERLGPSHTISLHAAEYLAGVYRSTNRFQQAEDLYRLSLEDASQAPKPDPEVIFSALFNLGDVYLRQDKLDEAEVLYSRLADEQRHTKGSKHPNTLSTLNNLATTLEKRRKFAESEALFRECLAAQREILGPQHPDTVTALYNLGHVLNDQGKLTEAEPLIRQSVDGRRQSLGADHPQTLYCISSLASVLHRLGRLDEAESLLRPCLETQKRVLGPQHRETILSQRHLDELLKTRAHLTLSGSPHP